MATKPLFDLSTIDLDARIAGPKELLSQLSQRGTFEMLSGVIYRDDEEGIIVGYKDIKSDDWWAADHIPGRPLFPGVLMIETGAQLCSYDYLLRTPENESFIGFGGVNQTRFRGMVEPNGRLYFIGKLHRVRASMFMYYAQAVYNDKIVFDTEILGVTL
ncbi:MAG: 3-hydroxyacyl-[acyl-carrier-protein] dehydratase [Planctomycetota bacterium]|jgi:3-hydroxyacyl-[acyl-carrier-protein] dehydratase